MSAEPTENVPVRRRHIFSSEVMEFGGAGASDSALLRSLADWLDLHENAQMYGLNLTLDYDGDGIRHHLHAIVDDVEPGR